MRKVLKIRALGLTILIIMFITGCSLASDYQNSIFVDDSKIIKEADSYVYGSRRGQVEGNQSNLEFINFTGMETIYKIKSHGKNDVVFVFDSIIKDGDFKVVVIPPDDEVINIINDTQEGSETVQIKEGISRVKLVGRKAKGEVTLKIDSNDNIEVEQVD